MKINEVVINEDGIEIARVLTSLSGTEIMALSTALTMTVPVLKGLFKTGKGIMKVKRMMDRASVRIANGVVKEGAISELESISEVEYSDDVQKDDMHKSDLDRHRGDTMSTGKEIKGYDIHKGEDEERVSYFIKDPDSRGFLGELKLRVEKKYPGMRKSEVFFDESIHGKGIAVELYKMAIVDFGHTITSDYTQSKGSKDLWKRLSKTQGIFVYGWNPKAKGDKEFFQWDADEDADSEVYHSQSSTDKLRDEMRTGMNAIHKRVDSGELTKQEAHVEWEHAKQGIVDELKDADLVRYNDIRLVATAKKGLDESVGSLLGMVLPSHSKMYNKAAEMMSSFHVEFPSYGLNKLAALVSKRTARDFDRRALVKVFKKKYPTTAISEQDIEI